MDTIGKLNLALVVIIAVLALNLVDSSMLGYVTYNLDLNKPECQFYNQGDIRDIPSYLCCPELQKQLFCELTYDRADYKCYVKEGAPYYLVNHKAMSYCLKEGYDVEIS